MRLRLKAHLPDRRDLPVLAGYCLASAVYIAIGVAWVDFLLSFWVGVAYLLVTAWLLPAAIARIR